MQRRITLSALLFRGGKKMKKYISKADADGRKKETRTQRTCLRCRGDFLSRGIFNRLCGHCNKVALECHHIDVVAVMPRELPQMVA